MVKNKKKVLFISIGILIILLIIIINNWGLKAMSISLETVEEGINTNAFVIQREEVIYFHGRNNVDLNVQDKTKVSVNSTIGTTSNSSISNGESLYLDIIDWKIQNQDYTEKHLFEKDLMEINNEIEQIEKKIANENIKENEMEQLIEKRKELEDKRQIIQGAFRFAFTDKDSLMKLKEEWTSNKNNIQGNITPQKLGITFPGYILYHKDGYENILHRDLLGHISSDYLTNINEYKNENKYSEEEQLVKFIDDSKMYIIVKVPDNSFLEEEEVVKELRKNIQWKKEGQESFYSYIENRRDVLGLFPLIEMKWQEKAVEGFLVDINNSSMNGEKVLTIKLDRNPHIFIGERQVDIYIVDNQYRGYLLPNSAIVKKHGKEGIMVLDKANRENFVEISVKKRIEEKVLLDPKKNMQLQLGDKLLVNPR